MVLMYRGFEGNKVFRWCRGHADRVTIMFPAEPFFDRCITRVLDETRAGKSVLAWGEPAGIDRLRSVLKERHIHAFPFTEPAASHRSAPRRNHESTLSLSLSEKDGAAA